MNIESSVPAIICKKIFPDENYKNAFYLVLILLLYMVIAAFGIAHHEMWRDELEPWLIGSGSETLSDFFRNMKMGSNPYVWYLILHFLSKITLNPVIVQLTHIAVASGGVYLLLRYAPFSILQKLFLCTGYYLVFEYGIIGRGYALTIFFLFLFCSLYRKYWTKNIPLAFVIFFLANATGGFGAILSISLLIFLLTNYYFNEMSEGKKKQKIMYMGWTVALIIFSIWVAMKSITPPADSVYADFWYKEIDTERMLKILSRVWSGFVPIASFSSVQFWNTNFLIPQDASIPANRILVLISVLFLVYSILLFSKKISVLMFYLAGTFGILLFSYLNGAIYIINGTRYNGFLFLVFIVSYWLINYFPEKKSIAIPVLSYLRERLKVGSYQNFFLFFLLGVNTLACAVAYSKDFHHVFSNVEKTGKYILSNNLQNYKTAGFIDYAISPITAYTRRPIYYPERDVISTFPIWTTKNYTTDMNQSMNRLLNYISKKNDTVLVILNFDLNTSMIGDIQFDHLADFKGGVVPDENFSVYLASKYNLENDIKSITSSVSDEKLVSYMNVVSGLLQQNKLDDCEKILLNIQEKAPGRTVARFHSNLGQLHMKKGNLSLAKKEFQTEIDMNLNKEEAYFQLGMLNYQLQKMDSALYCWEEVIKLNPNNVDAYSNAAVVYFNFKKDHAKAEQLWEKAVLLNPKYFQVYINLMMICQNQNNEECKLKYLRSALNNGMSLDEIRSKGIVVTDKLLTKLKQ